MTTLIEKQPYYCKACVYAMNIVTVCDKQCKECQKKQKQILEDE